MMFVVVMLGFITEAQTESETIGTYKRSIMEMVAIFTSTSRSSSVRSPAPSDVTPQPKKCIKVLIEIVFLTRHHTYHVIKEDN